MEVTDSKKDKLSPPSSVATFHVISQTSDTALYSWAWVARCHGETQEKEGSELST